MDRDTRSFPTVIISQADSLGNVKTFITPSDANGNFGIVGLPLLIDRQSAAMR